MLNQKQIYRFCAYCRAKLNQERDHKLCPKCGRHYYFNPKPCVGVLLVNSNNEVLLVKRAYEPFKDYWDIPGGFVENNEALEGAARRELKEETGLEVGVLKYLGSITENYHFRNDIVPIVGVIFSGEIAGEPKITVADDVSDYKFVTKTKIDFGSIAFENQRKFLQKILE